MKLSAKIQDSFESGEPRRPGRLLVLPFALLGSTALNWVNQTGAAAIFLLLAIMRIPRARQLEKVIQQVYYIGARSTMIIMLVGLFTGMVLGFNPTTPWSRSVRKGPSEHSSPCR